MPSARRLTSIAPSLADATPGTARPVAQHPTDFEERQQTNLSLSYVSRDIYLLVRPRLRREVHITRGQQLQGLDRLQYEEPTWAAPVQVVSIAIDPEQLSPQPDGRWNGLLMDEVLSWLLPERNEAPGTSLHIDLGKSHDEQLGTLEAVGAGGLRSLEVFTQYISAEEVYISHAKDCTSTTLHRMNEIFQPGHATRRLYYRGGEPTADHRDQFMAEMDDPEIEPHPFE